MIDRWTIPTCPECGGLVVIEGGYDGEYQICTGLTNCKAYDPLRGKAPPPVEVEVIKAP